MNDRKRIGVGIAGTAIAANCRFAPALAVLLGAMGLSAWPARSDFVLLPALVLFAGLFAAAARPSRTAAREGKNTEGAWAVGMRIERFSEITCPECGGTAREEMPDDACRYFYDCTHCGAVLKPEPGDCCVFCTYGTVACPPVQAGQLYPC